MRSLKRLTKENALWLFGVAISVVVTFFSYPPHTLGVFMFIGLVPVFMAMDTAKTWKQAAFRTWLYVFLGNAAICSWIAISIHNFSNLPVLVGYPAVLVLSIFEQGSWPVLAALRHIVHRRLGFRPLFFTPAALLFLDVCWPKFFPNTMGNVFYGIPWLCQLADLTGVWGLTALIALTNELVAALLLALWARVRRDRNGSRAWAPWTWRGLAAHGVFCVVVLTGAWFYGHWRLDQVHELMAKPESTLRIAIIQSNINADLQVRNSANRNIERSEILKKMVRLTSRAKALGPELVVWPETAVPDTFHGESAGENHMVTGEIDGLVRAWNLDLVFGARDQIGDRRYNSLFYLNPDRAAPGGVRRQVYHKTMLLPLAEHFPGGDLIPGLSPFIRSIGGTSYATGPGPTVIDGPHGLKFGPLICLEGLYARFSRALAVDGAKFLVNITNDAWFGDSMETDLHLYLTTFRSIETRRPLIRATSTGYSTVVDIDGSLRFKSDLGAEAALDDEVPLYGDIQTPFMMIGDAFIVLCGLYAAGPFAWMWFRRRRRRRA